MGLASTSTIGGSGGGGSVGKLTTTGASLGLGSSAQILELTQGLTSGKHFNDL